MAKKSFGERSVSLPAGIGIGAGVAMVISILGAVLLTFLLAGEQLAVESMNIGVLVILFVSSFLGTWVAAFCCKHHRLVVCLITAAVYLLTWMGMNAMFLGGEFSGVGSGLLVVVIAGIAAAFIGKGGAKSTKGLRKFIANGKIAQ